jgi:hypothetical protein
MHKFRRPISLRLTARLLGASRIAALGMTALRFLCRVKTVHTFPYMKNTIEIVEIIEIVHEKHEKHEFNDFNKINGKRERRENGCYSSFTGRSAALRRPFEILT